MQRMLTPKFVDDLERGILNPLLRLVQRDRDLIAEIRNNALDVYCKGQGLLHVGATDDGYEVSSHRKFWASGPVMLTEKSAVEKFCSAQVPFIKQNIAVYKATGIEIEFEQMLIRSNNSERLNSDYICIDRQVAAASGQGRTDLLGVYWPKEMRSRQKTGLPLALIEVKYRKTGKVQDVAGQLADYLGHLKTNFKQMRAGLQEQLRLKARLGLLGGLSPKAQKR